MPRIVYGDPVVRVRSPFWPLLPRAPVPDRCVSVRGQANARGRSASPSSSPPPLASLSFPRSGQASRLVPYPDRLLGWRFFRIQSRRGSRSTPLSKTVFRRSDSRAPGADTGAVPQIRRSVSPTPVVWRLCITLGLFLISLVDAHTASGRSSRVSSRIRCNCDPERGQPVGGSVVRKAVRSAVDHHARTPSDGGQES